MKQRMRKKGADLTPCGCRESISLHVKDDHNYGDKKTNRGIDKDLLERAEKIVLNFIGVSLGDVKKPNKVFIKELAQFAQEVRDEVLRLKDTSIYGQSITEDGKRVNPEKFFKSPEEIKLEIDLQKERKLADELVKELGVCERFLRLCSEGKTSAELVLADEVKKVLSAHKKARGE